MTVNLNNNFLLNARGIILQDSASITWAIDTTTNKITATGSGGGGGGLTSVGFADISSTPIFTVTNSPLVANGTLDIALTNQVKNTLFAGPTTGANAQPTFRAMVAADLVDNGANPSASVGLSAVSGAATTWMRSDGAPAMDVTITPTWSGLHTFGDGVTISGGSFTLSGHQLTLSANASVGGTNTGDQVIPAAANPTGTIGLAAVNGSATTWMRSDAAPALGVGISPTWTSNHIFSPAAGVALTVNAVAGSNGLQILATLGNSAQLTLAGNGLTAANGFGILSNGGGTAEFATAGGVRATLGTTGWSFNAAASGTTITVAAGTATITPFKLTAGTINTTALAGASEYDGASYYITNETTAGRGLVPVEQIFHLAADGSGITTIANFFGATSNIPLVSGGYYEIEITLYYVMGATGSVVTWTLTNSAAPTSMDLYYEMCPATGIVAPPGTATMLEGQILGGTTAAQTVVTGALTGGTNQYAKFRIMLKNGTGTSLKIQATETTTTTSLTPKIGSYWKCTRIPAGNVGTFAT